MTITLPPDDWAVLLGLCYEQCRILASDLKAGLNDDNEDLAEVVREADRVRDALLIAIGSADDM